MTMDVMRQEYKALSSDDSLRMLAIKAKGQELYDMLAKLGDSREISLAKTKTEEAVMWAIKHITA